MPHFEPAYEKNSKWERINDTPVAVVLSFHNQDSPHELYRFIEIFMRFMQLNHGKDIFNPMPYVRNADGKMVPLELLEYMQQYEIWERLSFYIFGDYYREILRMYCMYSLGIHKDEDVRNGFIRVLNDFKLGTERPTLN